VDFGGLRLRVRDGVFVPRVRTLAVVHAAEELVRPGSTVIDLCCGVGAVGAALLHDVGAFELIAVDIDPIAVEVAAENLGDHGVVLLGDLFAPIPSRYRGSVDVIVANAPYVPSAAVETMPREAREHEHRVALDGGSDGLDLHRRIAAEAASWLRAPGSEGTAGPGEAARFGEAAGSGGSVVIETSRAQASETEAIFRASGFHTRVVADDDVDGTAVIATLGG
jgi:release factor glutamine methyltransferase